LIPAADSHLHRRSFESRKPVTAETMSERAPALAGIEHEKVRSTMRDARGSAELVGAKAAAAAASATTTAAVEIFTGTPGR
jgi:hypothetical protein